MTCQNGLRDKAEQPTTSATYQAIIDKLDEWNHLPARASTIFEYFFERLRVTGTAGPSSPYVSNVNPA